MKTCYDVVMRTCSICKQEKPDDAFYTGRCQCRECVKARSKAWKQANPERVREIDHKARAKYISQHREEYNARLRAWNAANQDKLQVSYARRKAKKRGGEAGTTEFDYFADQEARDLQVRRRALTGFDWHIDHRHPIELGGRHEATNLAVVPGRYNASKKARWVDITGFEWILRC